MAATVVGSLVALLAATAAAVDLGCQNVWSGPSSNNGLVDCLLQRLRSPSFLANYAATFLFVVIAVLTVLIFIPFFSIRQCCNGCGGRNMRPGSMCYGGSEWDDRQEEAAKQYSRTTVTAFRVVAGLVFLLSFATVGLLIAAAVSFEASTRQVVSGVFDGATSLVTDTITQLRDALLSNGTYVVPGVSNATFDVTGSFTNSVNSLQSQVENLLLSRIGIVEIVLIVVSLVSTVTTALTIAIMCCSIRSCLPAFCTCWNFVMGVLFSLLAALGFLLSVTLLIIEGEAVRGVQRLPGVIEWYVVPVCDGVNPLPQLLGVANSALVNVSHDACTSMLSSCDNSTVYNPAMPGIAFVCNLTSSSVSTSCTSPADVQKILGTSAAKGPVCDGCTIATCPTQCNVSSVADATRNAVDAVNLAVVVQNAVNTVSTLAACSNLVGRLALAIRISRLIVLSFLVSFGLAWSALTFIVLICINFKGQKWNLSDAEMDGGEGGALGRSDTATKASEGEAMEEVVPSAFAAQSRGSAEWPVSSYRRGSGVVDAPKATNFAADA